MLAACLRTLCLIATLPSTNEVCKHLRRLQPCHWRNSKLPASPKTNDRETLTHEERHCNGDSCSRCQACRPLRGPQAVHHLIHTRVCVHDCQTGRADVRLAQPNRVFAQLQQTSSRPAAAAAGLTWSVAYCAVTLPLLRSRPIGAPTQRLALGAGAKCDGCRQLVACGRNNEDPACVSCATAVTTATQLAQAHSHRRNLLRRCGCPHPACTARQMSRTSPRLSHGTPCPAGRGKQHAVGLKREIVYTRSTAQHGVSHLLQDTPLGTGQHSEGCQGVATLWASTLQSQRTTHPVCDVPQLCCLGCAAVGVHGAPLQGGD